MKRILGEIVFSIIRLISKLPLSFHLSMAKLNTWVFKSLLRYRTEVIYINLSRSFPEMKSSHIKAIANKFYLHLGEIVSEAIWFAGSSPARLKKQGIYNIVNPEVLNEAYRNSPSVTLLTSHCGNWEIFGGIFANQISEKEPDAFTKKDLYFVYKELSSKFWNDVFMKMRTAPMPEFDGVLESKNALRFVLKNRDKKNIYIVPADQSPYASKTDVGEFMNQKTYGMIGFLGLAHKLAMSLVYTKMVNTSRGNYDIIFVPICDDASKYSPEQLLRMYFDELEKEINECPHNWLWSHNRWKIA